MSDNVPGWELRADHPDRQAGCLTDYRLDYQVNCRADRRLPRPYRRPRGAALSRGTAYENRWCRGAWRHRLRFVKRRRGSHTRRCQESGCLLRQFSEALGTRFNLGRDKIRRRRFVSSRQNRLLFSWRQDRCHLVAASAEIHRPLPVGENSCARRNGNPFTGPMNHLAVFHLPVVHIAIEWKRGFHQMKSVRIDAGIDRLPVRIS